MTCTFVDGVSQWFWERQGYEFKIIVNEPFDIYNTREVNVMVRTGHGLYKNDLRCTKELFDCVSLRDFNDMVCDSTRSVLSQKGII